MSDTKMQDLSLYSAAMSPLLHPTPIQTQELNLPKRLLVVDDDRLFGKMLHWQGKRCGVDVHHCLSFAELCKTPNLESFDMVLLDYDLGHIKGSTIAEFLQVFFARVPVAIVSSTSTWWFKSGDTYPACIRGFIHKDRTFEEILTMAGSIYSQHMLALASGEYKELAEPYPDLERLYDSYRRAMAFCGQSLLSGFGHLSRKKKLDVG